MLDLSRPQFFPPDTDYLIPGNAGNPINVTLGDGFVFPPNSFARLPENSQIVGTYATRGGFMQTVEIISMQVSVDYRSVLFTADVVFGGLTSMTIDIGGTGCYPGGAAVQYSGFSSDHQQCGIPNSSFGYPVVRA